MIVKNLYTAAAVNQVPTALDWGHNGLICYGACNAVLIVDPSVSKVVFHRFYL